ncbi:MAG: toll/interleukin-1 receptor domain-containing protein, partial [Acidobacteriota bacterium]
VKWVFDLAKRLREHGIEASIDQYEPRPAAGWTVWMERQIRGADRVLLVCTDQLMLQCHARGGV